MVVFGSTGGNRHRLLGDLHSEEWQGVPILVGGEVERKEGPNNVGSEGWGKEVSHDHMEDRGVDELHALVAAVNEDGDGALSM